MLHSMARASTRGTSWSGSRCVSRAQLATTWWRFVVRHPPRRPRVARGEPPLCLFPAGGSHPSGRVARASLSSMSPCLEAGPCPPMMLLRAAGARRARARHHPPPRPIGPLLLGSVRQSLSRQRMTIAARHLDLQPRRPDPPSTLASAAGPRPRSAPGWAQRPQATLIFLPARAAVRLATASSGASNTSRPSTSITHRESQELAVRLGPGAAGRPGGGPLAVRVAASPATCPRAAAGTSPRGGPLP